MKKIVFIFFMVMVLTINSTLFAADAIVNWKFDNPAEPRYTVNSANPGTMNLQLGRYLEYGSDDARDPAWAFVDGRSCVDFDEYSLTGVTEHCKASSSWTEALYQTLTPSTYTIEIVFSPQNITPYTTTYNSESPWCFLSLIDKTTEKIFYYVRMEGQKIKYICPDGTLTCDLAGQSSAVLTPGSWVYVGISYDGSNTTMTVRNMTENASTTVTQTAFGALGAWDPNASGAIGVGAEVYGTAASYRRSVDALIDEVKISSGVVADVDRLYNQASPIFNDRSFGRYDVDTFENYTTDSNMALVWEDYEINSSGADVSLDASTYFAGKKAMKYDWDSQYGDSIATAVYASPQDWSEGGFLKVLELVFKGMAGSSTAETLFVQIKDSSNNVATVNYPTSANLDDALWMVWRIPTTSFSGVDMANVSELTIGLTNGTSGTGILYFDNIRLYACRPTSEADINQDCQVNMTDFAELAYVWLNADLY